MFIHVEVWFVDVVEYLVAGVDVLQVVFIH